MTEQQKTAPIAESGSLSVLTGDDPEVPLEKKTVPDPFMLSIPRIGAYRTEDHKYYWNGRGPHPGATDVLDVMQKWGIYYGALKKLSTAAVYRWEEIGGMLNSPEAEEIARIIYQPTEEEPLTDAQIATVGAPGTVWRNAAVQKWLSKLPDRERDVAAKIGTAVHRLVDMVSRGQESDSETFKPSEVEIPFIEAYRHFLAFLEEHQGKIVSSEKYVWSGDGYAGTYDDIIRFGCVCHHGLWLVDNKTSATGPYPEWALQLIAYGTADFIIIEDDPTPYPMPEIQRYGVLHLRPDLYQDTGWRLIEYPLIPADRMAFLGALEIWRWKQEKRYTKSKLLTP
jgi:hypothetical protein